MARKSKEAHRGLRLLGNSAAEFPAEPSGKILETFANQFPKSEYTVEFVCDDFTSLCPITGQPDFARLEIEYAPGAACIETKSLKFYLASYRNTAAFNEEVANRILNDLAAACAPRWMSIRAAFAARGGITLTVEAVHYSRKKK